LSRIDKYLWHARFFKSRTQAADAVTDGKVRVNGDHCQKPSAGVKTGDVLTISIGTRVKVIKVLDFGTRRGPASEARLLYDDLTPPPPPKDDADAAANESPGPEKRPDKRDRRLITAFKNKTFDA
jgi:ribosome-associated heat shock protein Hsp15